MNPIVNLKKKSIQKDIRIDMLYMLETQIQALTQALTEEKDPAARSKLTSDIKTLIDLEDKYRDLDPEDKFSADAILGAIVNLAGIGFILNFEKVGIITSKALGFVARARLR